MNTTTETQASWPDAASPDSPAPRRVSVHYFCIRQGIGGLWLVVATRGRQKPDVWNPRGALGTEAIMEWCGSRLEAEAWRDMAFRGRIVTHTSHHGYAAGGDRTWETVEYEPASIEVYASNRRDHVHR